MRFSALVSIYRVTIPAQFGHLLNGPTLIVTVRNDHLSEGVAYPRVGDRLRVNLKLIYTFIEGKILCENMM